MKKLYLFLLGAAVSMPLAAQQLPGASFEQNWVTCTPWTSNNTNKSIGTTPSPWNVSHTIGANGTGKTEVGKQIDGFSGKGVFVENYLLEVKIFVITIKKTIPGYFALGTPWATSKGNNATNKDGGTFGGVEFKYRPDALSFYYQSTGSDQPTVIAYSWKGTYTQASVPGNIVTSGNPTTVTMTNRDRHILGINTPEGGAKTQTDDAARINKINTRLSAVQTGWKQEVIPFEYSSNDKPEKINVIFAAGDYFSDEPVSGNTLSVDEVKLVYYSRLESLTVNGAPVAGFESNKYDYDLSDVEMPSADAVTYSFLGTSGAQSATVNTEGNVMTITVSNSNAGGTDVDEQTTHTYTLTFKEKTEEPEPVKEYGGVVYNGNVTIEDIVMGEDDVLPGCDVPDCNVHIIADASDASKCQIVLPDFYLDPEKAPEALIGDIVVNNVTCAAIDGGFKYEGVEPSLKLNMAGLGEIVARVVVNGTVDNTGACVMNIDVIWLQDPENDPEGEKSGIPIKVAFNGQSTVKNYGGDVYNGNVTIEDIEMGEDDVLPGCDVPDCNVHIIADTNDSSKCQIVLPDFYLDPEKSEESLIGDIVVNNVTCTGAGDVYRYTGVEPSLKLNMSGLGEIVARVVVNGTVENKNCIMNIDVIWLQDPENDPKGEESGIPIKVRFNGVQTVAGINKVEIDNSNYPVEYYNINGMRVNGENLTPGIYIIRQGKDVKKVLVK